MATGYEAIDELQKQTNQLYNQQQEQQNKIIDTSTNQAIADIERNKEKTDKELQKTNTALYTDYQKQINPYGVNSERLAEQGLANSGLAETTKANYYNTYQNARTEATNNANTIKADFDADIVKARQNGDIQKAQSALELYKQKIADLSNFYNLRFNVDQFNYQKDRDIVSDNQWQQQYDLSRDNYNLSRDQYNLSKDQWNEQFRYQQERDKVADSQWQKQYDLQKKNSVTSSSSKSTKKSSSSKSSSNKTTVNLNNDNNKVNNNTQNNNQNSNQKFDIGEYSLDKTIAGIISKTEANSTNRKRLLTGQLKIGNITKQEYEYLLNIN